MLIPCVDEDAEVLLNEYVDGELPSARQQELFAHLASCADCRSQFNALLTFRLAAREEPIVLSAAANTAVLTRLDRLRRSQRRARSRRFERAPLGGTLHRRVSLGAAMVVMIVVAFAGMAFGRIPSEQAPVGPRMIQAVDARGAFFLADRPLFVEAKREPAE